MTWLNDIEREVGLSLNKEKSVFMPFKRSRMSTPFTTVKTFTYLGIKFRQNGDVVWDSGKRNQSFLGVLRV